MTLSDILHTNESALFDPRKLQGLRNDSDQPMRYLVLLHKENPENVEGEEK